MKHSYLFICSYDDTTGVFTVPEGADGLYFFSTYLLAPSTERSVFDITLNGVDLCAAYADDDVFGVYPQGTCTAIVWVTEGIFEFCTQLLYISNLSLFFLKL